MIRVLILEGGIGTWLTEILETGDLKRRKADEANPQIQTINQLTRVTGVGPKAALYVLILFLFFFFFFVLADGMG